MRASRFFAARYWRALFFRAREVTAPIFACLVESARAAIIGDTARAASLGDTSRSAGLANGARACTLSNRAGKTCAVRDSGLICP